MMTLRRLAASGETLLDFMLRHVAAFGGGYPMPAPEVPKEPEVNPDAAIAWLVAHWGRYPSIQDLVAHMAKAGWVIVAKPKETP